MAKIKNKNGLNRRAKITPVRAPAAKGTIVRNNGPINMASLRVRHVERFCSFDVISANVPDRAGYFQPGNLRWGRGLAANYEMYTMNSLKFIYVPIVGTGTAGYGIMQFDCDASDPLPADISEMMSSSMAVEFPVWQRAELVVPKSALNAFNHRFTRIGAPIGDQKLYDVGVLNMGSSVATQIGNIYVEYDMVLVQPQIATIPSGTVTAGTVLTSGTDHGFTDTSVNGKMPFRVEWPTTTDIGNGANAAFQLLRSTGPFQGAMVFQAEGVPSTMTPQVAKYGVTLSSLVTDASTSADENVSVYKLTIDAGSDAWMQPYIEDASSAVTTLTALLLAGQYSKLDL